MGPHGLVVAFQTLKLGFFTSRNRRLFVTYRKDSEVVAETISRLKVAGHHLTPLWKNRT